MTDGEYAELRALTARTAWLAPWVRRAFALGKHGPGLGRLRCVPMRACALVVRLELWRLRHGL